VLVPLNHSFIENLTPPLFKDPPLEKSINVYDALEGGGGDFQLNI